MRILITGNMGYVGPVLVRHLRTVMPDAYLIGFDNAYFAHCLTGIHSLPEARLDEQVFGDVRAFPTKLLRGVDAVVELAAISNDPMGSRFEAVTDTINFVASCSIARQAVEAGVKRIVFASSCSMYGQADEKPRSETDALNPLTAYAKSKVATEKMLSQLDTSATTITSLRFSTACGMSDRLRLDLVLNDFVACALSSGEISILSDGTPWRPLIEVRDMARAIEWALIRSPSDADAYLAVNVGSDNWTFQVNELAASVAQSIEGTRVTINETARPDKRSYKVDFSLFRKLAPAYQPVISLAQAIDGLKQGLQRMNFRDVHFRSSEAMRLKVLESHIARRRLDEQLNWL